MNKLDKIYDEIKSTDINDLDNFIKNYDDNQVTIETLLFVAYAVHKYDPKKEVVEEKVKRQFQTKFRNQVKKRYDCCVVSNDDVDMCEACHIIPYSESDYNNMYNVNNGLLLSSGLHTLFDKYMFSINKNGIIVLSKKMLDKSSYKNYHKYHNMKLKLGSDTMKNIAVHYEKFLEMNK